MTGTTFRTFPAEDELPHEVGEHPLWQESVFLTWGDRERGVFGFHRIGQEVNANGGVGLVTAWNGITTQEGTRFRRYVLEDMRAEDRHSSGFKASDGFSMDHDGTETRWRIDDPACSMDLIATDYTPRFDLYKDGGSVVDNFAAGHIEVGSTIRGSVELGGTHYDIDGLAYRDHSWGKRDRSTMLSHRWIAGTVGPELTFNATAWHGTDGSLRTYGIVCRNGEVSYARSVDIVVFVEIDAISHRGGLLRLELEDGELIEISANLVDGFLTQHHNTGCVDTLCEVEWNGLRGFCDLEMSTNPRAGTGTDQWPGEGLRAGRHHNPGLDAVPRRAEPTRGDRRPEMNPDPADEDAYSPSRYFDVVLDCLDSVLANEALTKQELFASESIRRVLVRMIFDRSDRPGYDELGVPATSADIASMSTSELWAAVRAEGQLLDDVNGRGDDRMASRSGALGDRTLSAVDIERALRRVGFPDAVVQRADVALGGRSKETILIRASGLGDLPADLVLRRDLQASSLGTSVASEFALLQVLHTAGAPTPQPHLLVEDTEPLGTAFVLVARMPGDAATDSLLTPTSSKTYALAAATALGRLHQIPVDSMGDVLNTGSARVGPGDIHTLETEWNKLARGKAAAVEAAFRWLLEQDPTQFDHPGLVHGDYNFHNLLFQGSDLTAVLDWELAHIGHPGEDLGYIKPSVRNVVSWDEFMATYRAAGGPDVSQLSVQFYGLWGTLRLATAVLRARALFETGRTDDPLKADVSMFWLPRVLQKLSHQMRDIIASTPH